MACDPFLRIGIIGMDTSHVPAFTKLFHDPAAAGDLSGFRVVAGLPDGSDTPMSRDRIEAFTKETRELGVEIVFFQSNHEGAIIDMIHEARAKAQAIIINPAALTHTSVAVLDALNTFDGPVIEVHISQVHKREAFRHHSFVSHRADAVMAGFGIHGYALAMRHMGRLLR